MTRVVKQAIQGLQQKFPKSTLVGSLGWMKIGLVLQVPALGKGYVVVRAVLKHSDTRGTAVVEWQQGQDGKSGGAFLDFDTSMAPLIDRK